MGELKVYTAKDAIEELRRIVKGNEGFVYTQGEHCQDVGYCLNWLRVEDEPEGDDGVYRTRWEPSCLVGHVLTNWGFPEDKKRHTTVSGPGQCARAAKTVGAFQITADAVSVLGEAQSAQDNGLTWGQALERAEREASYYLK